MNMEQYGLVEKLENLATAKGWNWLHGQRAYANIDADFKCDIGQLILWVYVLPSTVRGLGNRISGINYNCEIGLFRKFDANKTPASLDESFDQKYGRRLNEIIQTLSNELGILACGNNIQITSESYDYLINLFDTNMDGVMCRTVINQENFTA